MDRGPADQDLTIIYRDPKDLVAYARNSRTHTAEQIALIRRSIREFGFTNPILLRDDDKTIGAGHARHAASLAEGLDRVPTITLLGLTEEKWRAYVIADNQLAITGAAWDPDLLRAEMSDLREAGFDLSLTGFNELDLANIFRLDGPGSDPESTPPVPTEPITILGDLWVLGDHRLICGDSTDAPTVERLLEGLRPHLMVCDPPFGVNYASEWRNEAIGSNSARTGRVLNDDRADWREAWKLFPGDVAYVWFGSLHAAVVAESLMAAGFELRSLIIWNKPSLIMSRGHYHWKHESMWYGVKKGATGHWVGGRKQSTVWDIANRDQDVETVHSTQKPIECMRRPIENNSKAGDLVFEPFAGSGTTLIAAQMTGRKCRAVELSPGYCDVIVKRFENFTGQRAQLADTGETFAEVEARRAGEANSGAGVRGVRQDGDGPSGQPGPAL